MRKLIMIILASTIFAVIGTNKVSAIETLPSQDTLYHQQDSAQNKAIGQALANTGKKVLRIGETVGAVALGAAVVVGVVALAGATVGVVFVGVAVVAVISVPIICIGAAIKHKAAKNYPNPESQQV
jgi:hypothetical protein